MEHRKPTEREIEVSRLVIGLNRIKAAGIVNGCITTEQALDFHSYCDRWRALADQLNPNYQAAVDRMIGNIEAFPVVSSREARRG